MDETLYGVDLSKGVTPEIAKDAIVACFEAAHKEILDMDDEYVEWESPEKREKFRDMQIEARVKNAFEEAGISYDAPTKEGLLKVLDVLAKMAKEFRKPDVVERHYNEVKGIIDKIPDA